ncbi:MAG: Crp/Fnr family transcriptional regulator [Flaviramulus sp.]|nr:Crp/Fnr family transcriptional regulator [Flaviramulus sp.]NNC49526.1 Crp/Fnr family transcriptional regulator [Flaviramulus sp.]
MNPNVEYLNSFVNVSEEMVNELKKISVLKKIDAGTELVKLNEVPTKLYMLLSGLIRCYLSTESGKNFNKSFYLPLSFVGALTALLHKEPSKFVFEALEDSEVYEIDFDKFMNLCQNNPEINTMYSRILEAIYTKYEKRLIDLISLNATDRYLELKKQIPNVDKLIHQYHIASFLGITAVQLSRIRKKIDSD